MQELTKSQKARNAIKIFKTIADALALRGYYRPNGRSGQTLTEALKMFSPEIYGTMNDPRIIELKGLEYVIDRLPKGIENCTRIILTAGESFENDAFEYIMPLKRRRESYRISEKEICFIITRGLSEIYDVLTHITFLNVEAVKIQNRIKSRSGEKTLEWSYFEKSVEKLDTLSGREMDQAIWNLSIILGRTYRETSNTYEYLEKSRKENDANHGLFQIVYSLGKRMESAETSKEDDLLVYFTPTLQELIGHHQYASKWAGTIHENLYSLGLQDRPLHVISANLHSVMNTLYAYATLTDLQNGSDDFYEFITGIRDREEEVRAFAEKHGMHQFQDKSGAHIDYQIIDTLHLPDENLHPCLQKGTIEEKTPAPVIIVMDYAFGTQAFEVMDELLSPFQIGTATHKFDFRSISIMGKAGTLPGKKGDIMLATAHVVEGTTDNYIVDNCLSRSDFEKEIRKTDPEDKVGIEIHEGPIVTVLGTSLQNRDVLERFQSTSWKAVGLEMEGGHYQRAISAAIIRRHIPKSIRLRYAYYASDNPLISGQTLASGSMGQEGIFPTYLITKVIVEKILRYVIDDM